MNPRPITSGALVLALGACDVEAICSDRLIDACRKAADLSSFVGTEVAASLPAGNAVIGEGGAIHRRGKMSISVRTNMTNRSAPRIGRPILRSDGVAGNTTFDTQQDVAASYTAHAAVSALRGFRVGETRVGGVDLLGSLSRSPTFGSEDFRARSKGLLGIGIGIRVGVIEETRTLPGVSLAAAVHKAPTFSATTAPLTLADGGTVTLSLDRIDAATRTLRVAASKQFGRFGLTGGLGTDSYDVSAEYRINSPDFELGTGPQYTSVEMTRSNAFGGVSVALGRATLGAEVGRVFGGRQPALMNTFGDRPMDRGRTYVTLGVKMEAGRTFDRGR